MHGWGRENRLLATEAIRQDLERTLKLLVLQPGIGQPVGNPRSPLFVAFTWTASTTTCTTDFKAASWSCFVSGRRSA
jgi:hypothetical protein